MYRAYHAPVRTMDGGCCATRKGQPTNAVYIFVTMLRKLLNEHKPEYIAASFDLPGRTFRDDLAADYKANRTADARRARRADPDGACRVRGARRPHPHLRALRSRRRDRHAGHARRWRPASTSRSSPATRISFSSCTTASACSTRREEGTWYDAAGREGASSASRPSRSWTCSR